MSPDEPRGAGAGGDPACWAHLVDDERAMVVDLDRYAGVAGDGVHWTLEPSGDLNANLVHLDPGHEVGRHTNDEVDVLLVVLGGSGHVALGGRLVPVAARRVVHLPAGLERAVRAGAEGLDYLTVHRRSGGLTIGGPR